MTSEYRPNTHGSKFLVICTRFGLNT